MIFIQFYYSKVWQRKEKLFRTMGTLQYSQLFLIISHKCSHHLYRTFPTSSHRTPALSQVLLVFIAFASISPFNSSHVCLPSACFFGSLDGRLASLSDPHHHQSPFSILLQLRHCFQTVRGGAHCQSQHWGDRQVDL